MHVSIRYWSFIIKCGIFTGNRHGFRISSAGFSRREGMLSITEGGFSRREGMLSIAEGGFSRREGMLSIAEGGFSITSIPGITQEDGAFTPEDDDMSGSPVILLRRLLILLKNTPVFPESVF